MKIDFIPKSSLGKWSLGLGIALVVLTALSLLIAVVIKGNSAVIAGNSLFSIFSSVLSVMVTLAGPLSLFVGVFAVIKHKDWPACVSLTVLYGFALLMFVLGELLFPH